ncbi:MAG TPA: hypothetical protein ENN46_04320 [Candidatus Woesearchaeota archaeon]|nr:hypothetical protein [Candidatus Woesearchaeota archaeon]
MFIRTKKVKDNYYAYLVKNVWKDGKTRQKNIKYLGKVFFVNENHSEIFSVSDELVKSLALWQAEKLGFRRGKEKLELKENGYSIRFSPQSFRLVCEGKDCVIRANEGFFCEYTLKQLSKSVKNFASYDKSEPSELAKLGKDLAGNLLEAGIMISKEDFQRLVLEIIG